ncbi:hypothetical protein GCM10010365_46940 [Streptomyces poonensis]|uniref:histidine kinase n=1 Tax=Streptomyces poonensis TaxID=68255 RepID=A0A918PT77_9ACTN|nr:hypothetical protein GCM10010365_46940 [Streptomyces poonensis]
MTVDLPAPRVSSPLTGGSPSHAAAAAHQVRAPLTSIRLRLELLWDELPNTVGASVKREVGGVLSEVKRLSQVLDQVLTWGGTDHGSPAPQETVDAFAVAAARVEAWSARAESRGVRVFLGGAPVRVSQVPGALDQSLDVLLDNALQATPDGSRIVVAVRVSDTYVHVEVRDQGPGMTSEEIARACEPFWRGGLGRSHRGTGLGLTIAAALLTSSGGRLELGNSPDGGLRAAAVLPRVPA